MPRESSVRSVEKMLRLIRLVDDLAARRERSVPLVRVAAALGTDPDDAERTIRKVNLGCGDSLPELFVDYDEEERTLHPHRIGVALDRPLRLSPAEMRALVAVAEASGIADGKSLAEKIEGALPPVAPDRLKSIQSAARATGSSELLQTVTHAIGLNAVLDIVYRGVNDTRPAHRTIEPWSVSYDAVEGTWYIGAFCRRAQGWRTFKLNRIAEARETGERFDREARVESGPHGLAGVDRAPRAVLAVHDPSAIGEAYLWRGLARIERPRSEEDGHLKAEDRERGGFIASIPWVRDSPWLARMVVATFGRVEALQPAELRSQVRGLAIELHMRLRGTESGETSFTRCQ